MSETVICPHCGQPAQFLKSSAPIYNGRDYGPRYVCWTCDAHVGCHLGTVAPLGLPANKATRNARQRAHAAFDPLWRGTKGARPNAYFWLRSQMGLSAEECHIGMFTIDQCARVVELCRTREQESPADERNRRGSEARRA